MAKARVRVHIDTDNDVVKVNGHRATRARSDGVRMVFYAGACVVKIGCERQNRREAQALRSVRVRRAARKHRVRLPRLIAVASNYTWIAMERLRLRRPRLHWLKQDALYKRVESVMGVAGRGDFDTEYWNWALVGNTPAIYDLGV